MLKSDRNLFSSNVVERKIFFEINANRTYFADFARNDFKMFDSIMLFGRRNKISAGNILA